MRRGGRGASILDQSHCTMNESRPVSSFITFSFHLTVAEWNVRKFGKLSPFFLFYFRFTGSRGRFSPYRGEWNRFITVDFHPLLFRIFLMSINKKEKSLGFGVFFKEKLEELQEEKQRVVGQKEASDDENRKKVNSKFLFVWKKKGTCRFTYENESHSFRTFPGVLGRGWLGVTWSIS